jgi:phosphoenolpyruvate carboxykinase (ATP)
LLNAALSGALLNERYRVDPVFGFEVPLHCPEVPDEVLDPAEAWPSKDEHMCKYKELAGRFVENMRKFADQTPAEVIAAGPKL